METINIPVITSLAGTAMIVVIYIYLYFLYKERCIGIWAIAWTTLFSRYVFFDSGLLTWQDSFFNFFVFSLYFFQYIKSYPKYPFLYSRKRHTL